MSRKPCDIYSRIDDLDASKSLPDLIKKLKVILNEMAYFTVTGDGAVMETREQWHSEYVDALYSDAGSDRQDIVALPPPRKAADSVAAWGAPGAAQATWVNPNANRAAEPPAEHRQHAAPPTRPRPEALPASLRAIMEGTHDSFRAK